MQLPLLKFDLKMKFSLLFILSSFFTMQALDTVGQDKVTINLTSGSVQDFIAEIEKTTDFSFIYKIKDVDIQRKISVKATNEDLSKVLDKVFKNTKTTYNILDKRIFLVATNKTSKAEIDNATLIQKTVKGKVVDETGMGIPSVNVSVKRTTKGTTTDFNGNFEITVADENTILVFSSIGFVTQELKVGNQITITISLKTNESQLDEVVVIASFVKNQRKTPIAVSTINNKKIVEKLGNQEFVESLKFTPSVYTSKQGGGFGDSRINVRGFSQENVAVLINGIPVNDPEDGRLFWSNWSGISGVTSAIQVQRGLGASRLAINSIGGTINILTSSFNNEQKGTITQSVGNNNFTTTTLELDSGLLKGDWSFTVLGSRNKGDGYFDGTYYDSWSFFASIGKKFNDNHKLVFTALGAPQFHGTNFVAQGDNYYDNHPSGTRANFTTGVYDGPSKYAVDGQFNFLTNFYFKPLFTLNHYWDINEKTKLNTSVNHSFGRGGILSAFGSASSGAIFGFNDPFNVRNPNFVNYNNLLLYNEKQETAKAIIGTRSNDHAGSGLLSTLTHKLKYNLNLIAGIDTRVYQRENYSEVIDLLGSAKFLDNTDRNNPNALKTVGDRFNSNNKTFINTYGGFLQLEYINEKISAFVTVSLSNTAMKRLDFFNYLNSDSNRETDWLNFIGYNAKTGFGYNINDDMNVYINAGHYSKAPISTIVFGSGNNTITEVENEKIYALELGYGYTNDKLRFNVNGYYTLWNDRNSFQRFPDASGSGEFTALVSGQDARHIGIELDGTYKPNYKLTLNAAVSLGNWVWLNDVKTTVFPANEPTNTQEIQIFSEGLKVGDAAQTSVALGMKYDLSDNFYFGFDYLLSDNLYARFDPTTRQNPNDRAQAWKLPSYSTFDISAGYSFPFLSKKATLLMNVYNLFDSEYISQANDGANHNRASSTFYYGTGTTWSTTLKINF